jgi:protease I
MLRCHRRTGVRLTSPVSSISYDTISMRKTAVYLLTLVLFVGATRAQPAGTATPVTPATAANTMLVFLPQRFFADEEFDPLVAQFARAGLHLCIATTETVPATSMNRVIVNPDIQLSDVQVADYAGIVLIGGSGAATFWDDSLLHSLCRDFVQSGKLVAAIGIAPITLARAGVLKGRTATVFPERSAIGLMKQGGCRHSFKRLVVDHDIVTAATASEARAFSRTLAARLAGK